MPRIVKSESGATVGRVSAEDIEYLRSHFEIPSGGTETFYLDSAALSALPAAPPALLSVLQAALSNRDGVDLGIEDAPQTDTHPSAVTSDVSDGDVTTRVEFERIPDEDEVPEDAMIVNLKGRHMQCVMCKGEHFQHRTAQLHSAGATFFNVEWLGPSADCYICTSCRYVHWFLPR